MKADSTRDEEGISLIGPYNDTREESVSAGRQPVAADKGAAAQRTVARREPRDIDNGEEGDDHVGDFSRKKGWSARLRYGLSL